MVVVLEDEDCQYWAPIIISISQLEQMGLAQRNQIRKTQTEDKRKARIKEEYTCHAEKRRISDVVQGKERCLLLYVIRFLLILLNLIPKLLNFNF